MNEALPQGPALGKLISDCVERKLVRGLARNKTEIASYFGVRPPSLYGWMESGKVARFKMPVILGYFSDVSIPEEWGFSAWPDWVIYPGDHVPEPLPPLPNRRAKPERVGLAALLTEEDIAKYTRTLGDILSSARKPLRPDEEELLAAYNSLDPASQNMVKELVMRLQK